jgi:hypothetical protein
MRRSGFLKRAVPRRDPTPPEWQRRRGVCPLCLTAGWVDAHHIIEKQQLRKRGLDQHVWDTRNRLWAGSDCCHTAHTSRVRPIPRAFVPYEAEVFADELGLGWLLDKTYGERAA